MVDHLILVRVKIMVSWMVRYRNSFSDI